VSEQCGSGNRVFRREKTQQEKDSYQDIALAMSQERNTNALLGTARKVEESLEITNES
jgi:hypothetical protein